jgi:hypothetical protein
MYCLVWVIGGHGRILRWCVGFLYSSLVHVVVRIVLPMTNFCRSDCWDLREGCIAWHPQWDNFVFGGRAFEYCQGIRIDLPAAERNTWYFLLTVAGFHPLVMEVCNGTVPVIVSI